MQRSTDRVLTTHTGSLPRAPELLAELLRRDRGEPVDEDALAGGSASRSRTACAARPARGSPS